MIISPAKTLEATKEYYFSIKLKEIKKMHENGIDVINVGIGSPDLPPSDNTLNKLIDAARNPHNHGYQSYVGIKEFRKGFADKYLSLYGVDLNVDTDVLPLLGSKEGIMHISLTFLDPGDEVLVPNPGYPTYASASRIAKANIRTYDLLEKNGYYPDFEEIEKQDLSKVKLMWLNYPNMPTGAPATEEVFKKYIAFAHKHKILLVHDNPYSSILNHNQLSILAYPGAKEVALELNSMSKSHNMAGWRVGLVVGAADYIQCILKVKSNIDSGHFMPIQLAAAEACNNTPQWHADQNRLYGKRREVVRKIMDLIGSAYDMEQVGMFMWGKIPTRFKTSEEFTEFYLHKAHVFMTPGFIFGSNGEGYLRISLCTSEERLNEALERIRKIG
ncbi:MAG: aminotransferase class I/II-fold pyridoxal phosphate-dependent enzyme [Bacteroidetes bacterium]|nr:MAG: aminotransferase class I/II-fold pyridoxal phosphate-dependent enzyme [Bacteroidota bacterium]